MGELWVPPAGKAELAHAKIDAGNRLRRRSDHNDFFALIAASLIGRLRESDAGGGPEVRKPLERTAHIICTLKRQEEITTLRRIYGSGLFIVGVSASREDRDGYFRQQGIAQNEAQRLIEVDATEAGTFGQQTQDAFHLADVFVPIKDYEPHIERFLDLVFGRPTITPTPEEQAMFMAYGASLRSGDLSRQVGAAILDEHNDLLAVGCNEVPKYGGGLYEPGAKAKRDIERAEDSNGIEKDRIIERVLKALGRDGLPLEEARRLLKPTGLTDLTEFGRSVHAEMEALLACARSGRSPRGATLFTTTFPCHNCCRHIIAAGIHRVIYIEPYAKSKSLALHDDAVSLDEEVVGKFFFLPFQGIGPRRYFDLFSLNLSSGYPIERKKDGRLVDWKRQSAPARLQLQPSSYLQREGLALEAVKALLSEWSSK